MKLAQIIVTSGIALTLALATASHAAVLLTWDQTTGITGSGVNQAWPTATNDANVNPTAWTAGPGINSDDPDDWNTGRFRFFRPDVGNPGDGTAAQALAEGDYFEFAVEPAAGHRVSVESLNINGSIGNGTVRLELRSDLDGFATALDTVTVSGGTSIRTWTLPGTAHDDLTAAVTFRLYGYSIASAGHTLQIKAADDDAPEMTVLGTATPVPEPVSAVMIVGGLVAIISRRRSSR